MVAAALVFLGGEGGGEPFSEPVPVDQQFPSPTQQDPQVSEHEIDGPTELANLPDGRWTAYGLAKIFLAQGAVDHEEIYDQLADHVSVCLAHSGGDASKGICGPDSPKDIAAGVQWRIAESAKNVAAGKQPLSGDQRWIEGTWRLTLGDAHEHTCLAKQGCDGIVLVARILVDESIAQNVADLMAHAKRDGIELKGWGWRSHEKTRELRIKNCDQITGPDDPDMMTLPPGDCRVPTAIPGTDEEPNSRHESGEAIDFYVYDPSPAYKRNRGINRSDPEYAWLAEHAEDYGLFELHNGREPWHWSRDGA